MKAAFFFLFLVLTAISTEHLHVHFSPTFKNISCCNKGTEKIYFIKEDKSENSDAIPVQIRDNFKQTSNDISDDSSTKPKSTRLLQGISQKENDPSKTALLENLRKEKEENVSNRKIHEKLIQELRDQAEIDKREKEIIDREKKQREQKRLEEKDRKHREDLERKSIALDIELQIINREEEIKRKEKEVEKYKRQKVEEDERERKNEEKRLMKVEKKLMKRAEETRLREENMRLTQAEEKYLKEHSGINTAVNGNKEGDANSLVSEEFNRETKDNRIEIPMKPPSKLRECLSACFPCCRKNSRRNKDKKNKI